MLLEASIYQGKITRSGTRNDVKSYPLRYYERRFARITRDIALVNVFYRFGTVQEL